MADKNEYAYYCYQLLEGNTAMIETIYEFLHEDKLIDENDEWIEEK